MVLVIFVNNITYINLATIYEYFINNPSTSDDLSKGKVSLKSQTLA